MNELSFRTLLYRYFFFGWLLREPAPEANLFVRAAARRHNRQQARWLPLYMLRWVCLSLILYGLGAMAEGTDALSDLLYAASASCMAMLVMIATVWVGLTRSEEPA